MPYIFIDESGQFSKGNNEKYFVIGSFTVGKPRRTEKQFKSWQRSKFPKRMRFQPEIKFSDVKIEDNLRLKTLKCISDLDIRIRFIYLQKKNIPEAYWKKKKLKSGLLYTNIVGELLDLYLPINDFEFRVFCDERHLKRLRRSKFKRDLKSRLLPNLSPKCIIQIEMIDSKKNVNIQIADWIVGALGRYLENKNLGDECFQILKNNIISEGKELFKDYWEEKNKQKNQSND